MIPEQVIEQNSTDWNITWLAHEAGFDFDPEEGIWLAWTPELQRFAELWRNKVLEEAAKVCDQRWAACPQVLADHIRGMKK